MTILQPPFLEVNHQQIFSRGDGGSRAANQQIGNRKEAQENLSTTNHHYRSILLITVLLLYFLFTQEPTRLLHLDR